MKWLLVEDSVLVVSGEAKQGSETWAAKLPCGVIVRHVLYLQVATESMLYIHGVHVHVHDIGGGRGQLVGA